MALSEKDILQVLDMFQKSGWDGMQLESGSFKLSISKTGRPQPLARGAAATVMAPVPSMAVSATSLTAPPTPAVPTIDPRWVAVKAPLLGHFYASPKPGAPPFVALGQSVAADDTVAILEVMKLMNHVKAGVAGRVARIAVNNGDLVEFDQPILYIDPA